MNLESVLKSSIAFPASKKLALNLLMSQNAVLEQISSALKPFELSIEQFNVLRILRGQQSAPLNMHDIQQRMFAKTSNTTRLVDKLLAKELVTRNVCPANRRKIEVQITEKGLELLNEVSPLVDAAEQSFCAPLSPSEVNLLIGLLEKLRTNTSE